MDHIKFAFEELKKNPVPWVIMNLIYTMVPLANVLFSVQMCRVVRDCIEEDRAPEVGDLFKTEKLGTDITAVLIYFGCIFVSVFLCYLPALFVAPVLAFTPWIAADDKLTGMDAVKASFYWGKDNWLHCFTTLFILGIVAQLSILACGVGIFFVAMLMHLAHYSWYRQHRDAIYRTAAENGLPTT